MTLKETKADQNFNKFVEFHRANPRIWELFKKYTFEILDAGHTQYSSRAVVDRIRWHINIETTEDQFKISNSHSVYYSRLFHIQFPEHDGFFNTRELTTKYQEASDSDGYIPIRPAGDETDLNLKLKGLVHQPEDLFGDSVKKSRVDTYGGL